MLQVLLEEQLEALADDFGQDFHLDLVGSIVSLGVIYGSYLAARCL